jgi:hypothetical protein
MMPLPFSRSFNARLAFASRRPARVAILCAAFLALGAADASAAVRYAAPGGTAPAASACPQANPCSLFNAASEEVPGTALREGDEVVVKPGTYSDLTGELGPDRTISPDDNVTIHGEAGEPRPLITVHGIGGSGAFHLDSSGVVLSRVEIVGFDDRRGFSLFAPGIVEDVVVRINGGRSACSVVDGVVRDSVCLANGNSASGVEANFAESGTVRLRNVTAIAHGRGSHGLEVKAEGLVTVNIDAVGVLARGDTEDVHAEALSLAPHIPGAGARVAVTLEHSDFVEIGTETDGGAGSATITAPGSGRNITAEPLLAADGYHQLPGSPTVDAGATDVFSGATDVDGNQRIIGAAADIGADELQIATTTALACGPASVAAGASATCTATVRTTSGSPTGIVRLGTDGPGAFAAGGSCSLLQVSGTEASCRLTYTPSAVGSGTHKISGTYQGDGSHSGSDGSASIQVVAPPATPPNTTLKKKPARKSTSRRATFTFVSSQAGSRFECKLDKGAFKPCRSPFKRKVKPGRHSFRVRAVSSAGGADPTPVIYRWRVS